MSYSRTVFLRLLCLAFGCLTTVAVARPVTPFYNYDIAPLAGLYGLPALQEARILQGGEQRYRLMADIASNYTFGRKTGEELIFDGETTRIIFDFAGHLGRNLEWGLQIPYLGYSGGQLDGLVRGWHDVFGLPQGGRDRAPVGVLDYRYTRNGDALISRREEDQGLGDIRLSGGWQIVRPREGQENALALRSSLKLPSGKSRLLLGSGSTDLAVWLSAARGGYGLGYSGSVFGGLGVLLMSPGDVLTELQRSQVSFASLGAGAWVLPRLGLKLQLDYHGAIYKDTALTQLGGDVLQLSIGGSLRLVKGTEIELSVVEDLAVAASSDVVFHVGITVSE